MNQRLGRASPAVYSLSRGEARTLARQQAGRKHSCRVLLTRARQGMVIVVPPGEPDDPTRDPAFYDGTCRYLRSIGIPELG